MNTGASGSDLIEARARVLGIQTKLHRWATGDPRRRFDDLFNLVADPAFLLLAWHRLRGNKGARSAGVDGQTARTIEAGRGVAALLADLRSDLKAGRFAPLPVREAMIPKSGGRLRRLGIPAPGPRRAGRVVAGARADLRGGFPAVLLRLPPQAPHARRDRRDRPLRPDGAGASSRRGQARTAGGEGVPEGRDPR